MSWFKGPEPFEEGLNWARGRPNGQCGQSCRPGSRKVWFHPAQQVGVDSARGREPGRAGRSGGRSSPRRSPLPAPGTCPGDALGPRPGLRARLCGRPRAARGLGFQKAAVGRARVLPAPRRAVSSPRKQRQHLLGQHLLGWRKHVLYTLGQHSDLSSDYKVFRNFLKRLRVLWNHHNVYLGQVKMFGIVKSHSSCQMV